MQDHSQNRKKYRIEIDPERSKIAKPCKRLKKYYQSILAPRAQSSSSVSLNENVSDRCIIFNRGEDMIVDAPWPSLGSLLIAITVRREDCQ